jgi:hypothetical protein
MDAMKIWYASLTHNTSIENPYRIVRDATLKAGDWVMTGSSKNPINYVMSGTIGPSKMYPFANSSTTTVMEAQLKWPSGWEAWKGVIGQRIFTP